MRARPRRRCRASTIPTADVAAWSSQAPAFQKATWDEALAHRRRKLGRPRRARRALLTGARDRRDGGLADELAAAARAKHVMFEPFAYEAVRAANQKTFGLGAVPRYDFAAARCVVSFGADFLETFGSPVDAGARLRGDAREPDDGPATSSPSSRACR